MLYKFLMKNFDYQIWVSMAEIKFWFLAPFQPKLLLIIYTFSQVFICFTHSFVDKKKIFTIFTVLGSVGTPFHYATTSLIRHLDMLDVDKTYTN